MRGVRVVQKWSPVIAIVVTNAAMGSVNALMKKALDVGVNHMIIAAYRMAISAFILAPIAYFLESGLLGASLMQFFYLLGLSYTSATVSSALVSMLPAITFALALILRTENAKNLKTLVGMLKVMGTLICISGALFLTFYKGPQIANSHSRLEAIHHNKSTENWLLGCLYSIIGTTLLSMWMLFQGTLQILEHLSHVGFCSIPMCSLESLQE